ncbi:MAG: hypothetical protein CMI54_01315 [Parcubacteria group bacterium]|nr:hypothetical protein [Parcubacteria group bacterium]|tara:strand:+ start:1747 stop:2871 length:1125 start_codon:yes stop_codon:yes gene_type:complete
MRILFLTNHLEETDGWSSASWNLIEQLKNQNHEVLVLVNRYYKRGKLEKDQQKVLLPDPLKLLANPFLIFLTARKISSEIAKFSPNVIHFMVEPYALCLPFLKTSKAKTFLTVHGTYSVLPILFKFSPQKVILNYLSKKYYQKLDIIVAVSNYTKRYLLKYYSELREKVRVITNGINFDQLFENPKPKSQVKKYILFVGQVKKRKGLLEAIEALKYYRDNFSDNLIFDIVGNYNKNDEYYKKLVHKLKEYKLGDENSFKGRVSGEDLHTYYRNADLLLMTSLFNHYFEGFGLVFLEANAKGTPGIGSRNSGCEDAILDEKTGYLVDPCNPKEVAEKIDMVLNKNTIQAQNCIEWAKQNDIKIKVKELLNFYHGR